LHDQSVQRYVCAFNVQGYILFFYNLLSRLLTIESTITNTSGVKFSEVAGLKDAKQALREAIILPVMYPHLFTGARKPWKRILLYGPPGTGKVACIQVSTVNKRFFSIR